MNGGGNEYSMLSNFNKTSSNSKSAQKSLNLKRNMIKKQCKIYVKSNF